MIRKFSMFLFLGLFLSSSNALASGACDTMGGTLYCDSSAGRCVCKNGFYSSYYCTRHAVMDLQKLRGCCLWHGGVLKTDEELELVICQDGSVSEECSIEYSSRDKSYASW